MRTHGLSHTRAYNAWRNMHNRCSDTKDKRFVRYGGRGIVVCERWQKFENFFTDMGECEEGFSIERRNNDGNYEPDNCVWIPRGKQSQNRSGNHYLEIDGEMVCASEAARRLGIKPKTLLWRLSNDFKRDAVTGWVGKGVRLTFNGETLNIRQWSQRLGINEATITTRRRKGWPIERVLGAVQ